MKQELDQKLANLHAKLSNIVLDEMDKQLDKIKLFGLAHNQIQKHQRQAEVGKPKRS